MNEGVPTDHEIIVDKVCRCSYKTVPKYVTKVTIVEGIQVIPDSYFKNCINLRQVNLPQSLRVIGKYAFSKCFRLEIIYLPRNINGIEKCAFKECKSLREIDIPPGIQCVPEECFSGCLSLKQVNLPPSVGTISKSAFWNCNRLKIINLESISFIGRAAFMHCGRLETVYVSNVLSHVFGEAFSQCKKLLYFGPRRNTSGVANEGDDVIPQDIHTQKEIIRRVRGKIFDQGTKWRIKLRKFFLPDGIILGGDCFQNCNAIGEISIPGDLDFSNWITDGHFQYYNSVFNAVEIRPVKCKIKYNLIFYFLYEIVMKIPKMATKPCTPEQLYPFDVALKWLGKNGGSVVPNMSLHDDNREYDREHTIRVIFLFLRHNPSLICDYI